MLLDVVGGAVVAVLPMEPRHGRDVLCHMLGQASGRQLVTQAIGWHVLGGDRPPSARPNCSASPAMSSTCGPVNSYTCPIRPSGSRNNVGDDVSDVGGRDR